MGMAHLYIYVQGCAIQELKVCVLHAIHHIVLLSINRHYIYSVYLYTNRLIFKCLFVYLLYTGTLQAERTVININASDKTAVLRCFLYGYLPSGEKPSIKWQEVTDMNQSMNQDNIVTNDSIHTITFEPGDMLIQNGGAQPVPSLTSTLTMNLTRYSLTTNSRLYTCLSNQATNSQVIRLGKTVISYTYILEI